ncbi:MAG: hypothetical protein QME96_01090 [Myxococcota bacterium]|nr:hypothetical protein [Myxococcota bacterium]
MARKDVDGKRLRIRKAAASSGSGVRLLDRVLIIVTKAFCPAGHNLVGVGPARFDGFEGIGLWVADATREGLVELSPLHGDASKTGPEFPIGTRLSLRCPTCRADLPTLAGCTCSAGGELRKVFLTDRLDDAHIVALCDVWGCTRSRVIDGNEILSEWLAGNIEAPAG